MRSTIHKFEGAIEAATPCSCATEPTTPFNHHHYQLRQQRRPRHTDETAAASCGAVTAAHCSAPLPSFSSATSPSFTMRRCAAATRSGWPSGKLRSSSSMPAAKSRERAAASSSLQSRRCTAHARAWQARPQYRTPLHLAQDAVLGAPHSAHGAVASEELMAPATTPPAAAASLCIVVSGEKECGDRMGAKRKAFDSVARRKPRFNALPTTKGYPHGASSCRLP